MEHSYLNLFWGSKGQIFTCIFFKWRLQKIVIFRGFEPLIEVKFGTGTFDSLLTSSQRSWALRIVCQKCWKWFMGEFNRKSGKYEKRFEIKSIPVYDNHKENLIKSQQNKS